MAPARVFPPETEVWGHWGWGASNGAEGPPALPELALLLALTFARPGSARPRQPLLALCLGVLLTHLA